MEYNEKHGITPTSIVRSKESILQQTGVADKKKGTKKYYTGEDAPSVAADPVVAYMGEDELEKLIQKTQKAMEKAAKELNFMEAARLRDEMTELKKLQEEKQVQEK